MYTKLIYLISFVLALSLVGNVQATTTWTDADAGDHLWSTVGNWDDGLPDADDWAKIRNGDPGPTIASEGAVADKVHVGYDPNSVLTVDGGTLAIVGVQPDLLLGKNGGSGTLNMISGTITIARDLEVAGGDPGVINMTGGTIIVGDDFEIPESQDDEDSIAQVNLDGGTIILDGSYEGDSQFRMFPRGTLNITAGTLIIDANVVSIVQGYIDSGWITAYAGQGTLNLDYSITNRDKTTLKAVHNLKPNPVDGSTVGTGELELSWTLPDPCVPGQPVNVNVYFTDDYDALAQFTDPAAIQAMQVVNNENVTSVVVQTQPKTRYYWAVDTYLGGDDPNNNPFIGPIFSFLALQVDAGPDLLTWPEDDGTRTKNLDATITDEGAYTVQWTVISEPDDPNSPDAVITDPSAEDTSITLSAVGEYVLLLEVIGGESDTITINVYNDGCEAARSLPDYVPFPGDLNGDCRVDDLDLAILEADWLEDNSLTEP